MVAPGWMSTPERECASSAIRRGTMGTPSRCDRVREAMRGDGQEARVGGDDLVERLGGGIAREDGLGVLEAARVDLGQAWPGGRSRARLPAARSVVPLPRRSAHRPHRSDWPGQRSSRAGCVANCGKRLPMSASKMLATSRLSGNGWPLLEHKAGNGRCGRRGFGRSGHGSPWIEAVGKPRYPSVWWTSIGCVARR